MQGGRAQGRLGVVDSLSTMAVKVWPLCQTTVVM
jgi:hypothetical protein